MTKQDIFDAVEDLNSVLGLDPAIDPNVDKVLGKVKEASLWLYASDNIKEVTVEVLNQLQWDKSDFENLKKDQDPVPAFQRYGIGPYAAKAETVEKAKAEEVTRTQPKPEPEPSAEEEATAEENFDDYSEEELEEDSESETIDEEPPENTKPTPAPKAKTVTTVQEKLPSAYGTALALMGPDPEMPLHELYNNMRDLGFDIPASTGSIKTAHSIFRKVYKYLKENGHIKE